MRPIFLLIIVMLLLSFLVGCSNSSDSETTNDAKKKSKTLVRQTDALKGTFSFKAPDRATWAIRFDGIGKFTLSRNGFVGVSGTYKIAKDEITFTDEKGRFLNKKDERTGIYKWKLSNNKLRFTKVNPASKHGGAFILTTGAWQRTKE